MILDRLLGTAAAGWLAAVILAWVIVLSPPSAQAQQEQRHSIYGIGDNEFLIGGWFPPLPGDSTHNGEPYYTSQIGSVIDWARSIGANVFRISGEWYGCNSGANHKVSVLMDTAEQRDPSIRFILAHSLVTGLAGSGREARLYMMPDSGQYLNWQTKFLRVNGGSTNRNLNAPSWFNDDWNFKPTEQVYTPDSVAAGTVIADSMVLGWRPEMTHWWSRYRVANGNVGEYPGYTQMRPQLHGSFFGPLNTSGPLDTVFVVAVGHLFEDAIAAPDTAHLFEIDVFYDIDMEDAYRLVTPDTIITEVIDTTGDTTGWDTTVTFTRRPVVPRSEICTTFVVRRGDLAPIDGKWSDYRQVQFAYDAHRCNDSVAGPMAAEAESKRLNIRVRYMGNEKAALRCISLRDSVGRNVLGEDTTMRHQVREENDFYRYLGGHQSDTLRRSIISFVSTTEPSALQASCADSVNTWLKQWICRSDPYNGGRLKDSLTAWVEDGDQASLLQASAAPLLIGETGCDRDWGWLSTVVYSPYATAPTLQIHNGGRFGVPLLEPRNDSIDRFEFSMQRLGFKQYLPEYPVNMPRELQMGLWDRAAMARQTNRRLIAVVFNNAWVRINEDGNGNPLRRDDGSDSLNMARIPEFGDLRTAVALALAHGATGIFWQDFSVPADFLAPSVVNGDTVWHGNQKDFDMQGLFVGDTLDYGPGPDSTMYFSQPKGCSALAPAVRAAIPHFYSGWGVRTRATREINRWLRRIGPELLKLRWRDSYSSHLFVPMPFRTPAVDPNTGLWADNPDTVPARPLPDSEIVTAVHTYFRTSGGEELDSPDRTYIELGMFDPIDTTDNSYEVAHHVFVVQRRVFESPDHVDTGSAERRLFDSLAETRRIDLKFNLQHALQQPDSLEQFLYIRVREIEPDTAALPGTTTARQPLDTIIPANGIASIVLGPGRAALLRVTYEPLDGDVRAGVAAHNNQHKSVWSSQEKRYHLTYYRPNDSGTDSRVYYRRSNLMASPQGRIAWEPIEYDLGTGMFAQDTFRTHNAMPSMTMRTMGDSTVLRVVWSCHRTTPVGGGQWEVVSRNILSEKDSAVPSFAPLEHIGRFNGADSSIWGTPVVARLDSGEMVAWSDSSTGIRVRSHNANLGTTGWWTTAIPADWSPLLSIPGTGYVPNQRLASRYPSLPLSASIHGNDPHVGIVWQASLDPMGLLWNINYARTRARWNTPWNPLCANAVTVTPTPGACLNPSIDAFQDTIDYVHEGITWERRETMDIYDGEGNLWMRKYRTLANMAPVRTHIYSRTNGDSIGAAVVSPAFGVSGDSSWTWESEALPSIAALHYGYDDDIEPDPTRLDPERGLYAVAWRGPWPAPFGAPIPMWLATWYSDLGDAIVEQYSYGGENPNVSASTIPLYGCGTTLYQTWYPTTNTYDLLRSTREFFGKAARPTGYFADGRQLAIRTGDTAHAGAIELAIDDLWVSDIDSARGIRFAGPASLNDTLTDLPHSTGHLSSRSFRTHDSLTLGLEVTAWHNGDTAAFGSARLTVRLEIVDSLTDQRVALLDSFQLYGALDTHAVHIERELGLDRGTYFLRTLLDTCNIAPRSELGQRPYPVGVVKRWVSGGVPLGKLRRIGRAERAPAELVAVPDPARDRAEIRFTVAADDYVTVSILDLRGRVVSVPLTRRPLEAGRYSVTVQTDGLAAGTYALELRSSAGRRTGMMRVAR